MKGEPTRRYEIPLWEVNHSSERLKLEEQSDWVAYRLGYEMTATAVDPTKKAYKNFEDKEFPDGNITTMDYIESLPVAISFDFNRKIQTCVLCQKQNGRYIAFDEVVTENALTSEQAVNVANRLLDWGIYHVKLYGDNTGDQKARHGKSDWEYVKQALTEAGISFSSGLRKANPARDVRVEKVNSLIYNQLSGQRNVLIHERCQTAIKDYKNADTDEDGTKIDSGKIGHISDAFDYYVYEDKFGGSSRKVIW